ncbi:MAG: peptidase S1 [Paracoccus sp. (in: a-proteobacteria)]|nr:peptidase S1 [Paracoccus sp. (in: a-proteobacteria)]
MIGRFLTALCAVILIPAAAAACPNWRADPSFGNIALGSGFTPDPHVQRITAGGTHDVGRCLGNGWTGRVSAAPDIDFYWGGGSLPLTIAAEVNSADAVLLINGPDGTWHYNDDYRGLNPALRFPASAAGLYSVWIGTYDGSRRNPGRLVITELSY